MNRNKPQFSRLLEIDRRIRARQYPNCLTFSMEWEVSQKTVQRDIDYLRDQLGAPIQYDRDKKGFYYADANWFLPSLSVSEGDLLTLLLATRALEAYRGTPVAKDLERVFGKIAALLPEKLSVKPELIFSRFSFTSPPSKPIDPEIWVAIVRGLLAQRALKVSYQSLEAKEPKTLSIKPYHVANLQGEWYLFGHCEQSDSVLQLSLARMKKVELTETDFPIPTDFDAQKLLANAFGRFAGTGKPQQVRLLFSKEVTAWVEERQWHPRQVLKKRTNGDIELSFPATGLYEVFRWVLAWGRQVRVLEPRELRTWVADEVRAMGKALRR